MAEIVSVEDRTAGLMRTRELVDELAPHLKPYGLVRRGAGYWKRLAEDLAFAGVWINAWPVRNSKRFDVMAVTLCGWHRLHALCWPAHRKSRPFSIGPDFAQFEHHIVDPRGQGFIAKTWSLWPSTNVHELAEEIAPRIVTESLPALEIMFDRRRLANQLRAQRTVSIMPRSHYQLTAKILNELESDV